MCHYVFYSLEDLDKAFSDEKEEAVCTAMSLCILREYFEDIKEYFDFVSGLENLGYKNGAALVESVNYKPSNLAELILKKAGYE